VTFSRRWGRPCKFICLNLNLLRFCSRAKSDLSIRIRKLLAFRTRKQNYLLDADLTCSLKVNYFYLFIKLLAS
jgi:hypothetical protein